MRDNFSGGGSSSYSENRKKTKDRGLVMPRGLSPTGQRFPFPLPGWAVSVSYSSQVLSGLVCLS